MAENDVLAVAHFPESNPFGLITNGENNNLIVQIANTGSDNYTVVSTGASYHDPTRNWKTVKNATTVKSGSSLSAGKNQTLLYGVNSEFRPQELGLTVWVNLQNTATKDISRITAFNQTVSIVEPASSWFDPQVLFMYIVVGAALVGGAYAAFQAYFAPQKGKKKGTRARRAAPAPAAAAAPVAADGKTYDDDWIPAQHLRKRTGASATASGAASAASGTEATSGGESGTGAEKTRRRKARK